MLERCHRGAEPAVLVVVAAVSSSWLGHFGAATGGNGERALQLMHELLASD